MNRFFLLFSLILCSVSLLSTDAEARRLGGGSSIGKQRSMSPQQAQSPSASPTAAAAPAAGNKWMGPLAGLAIGAGLGALLAGGLGGMNGAMGGIMMALAAGALVLLLFRMKKPQPAQFAGNTGAPFSPPASAQQSFSNGASAAPAAAKIPADFPTDAFLRSAKTSFIRLQAANDRKDLNDIREYTTPEMFAEISMQLQERGAAPQTTEVLAVNTVLLEVATENNHAIASVRITAQLRENGGSTENVDEVWHVQKNLQDDKAVWLLSGIQQLA